MKQKTLTVELTPEERDILHSALLWLNWINLSTVRIKNEI